MRRTLFAVLLLLPTLCAQAQKTDIGGIGDTLLNRYYACVRASAAVQIKVTMDRRLAVEQAFLACATEEHSIRTFMALGNLAPSIADAVILKHKNTLKQELLQKTIPSPWPPVTQK
jgi:hypothetical protein